MKVFTPNQIKILEKDIIDNYFISEEILMENAAHAIYREIEKRFKSFNIMIVCGPGNNGGDGFALARILTSQGWNVNVKLIYPPIYKSSSLKNYNAIRCLNTVITDEIIITEKTLIVDAIFGIGLNRSLDEATSQIIQKINNSKAKVLSIDIPSGVNALNGEILGESCIKADITVTFLGYKIGQFMFPGADYLGDIIVSKISAPLDAINKFKTPIINKPLFFNEKPRNSHKNSLGKVLTIAGSPSYFGAPYFTSKAVLLSGSGNSTLLTTKNIIQCCATLAPEIVYKEDNRIKECLKNSTTVVFGPGIGVDSRAKNLLLNVLENPPKNLIIDADGLSIISEDINVIKNLHNTFVITPHPGEMAKIMNCTIQDVEKNRVQSALKISKDLNCIVVLKGVYTIIATPEGEVYVNNISSVTLATLGSGDILCGIIASLCGYTDILSAVRAGVYIHGLTGIIAEKKIGIMGVIASDLLDNIPEAIKQYKKIVTQ